MTLFKIAITALILVITLFSNTAFPQLNITSEGNVAIGTIASKGEMPSETRNTESTTASAINYKSLKPVLIEAINELEAKVDMLENKDKEEEYTHCRNCMRFY